MLSPDLIRMYDVLVSFLGPSKDDLDESLQLQFSCPRCQDREGVGEKSKFHLEVNIQQGIFNCWKCSSLDESMHGSIFKLIRNYGNSSLLTEYKRALASFKASSLYQIKYKAEGFQDDYADKEETFMSLPKHYQKFIKGKDDSTPQFKYLQSRGIDWDIIERYDMGYITYHDDDKSLSNRIILPSFNEFGELNYWTGRDFTLNIKRQRYFNPVVERKDIIFNENKINWNADVTLVEGPFDHIVVPNSIPLLGKNLNAKFYLYHQLIKRCHANVNIFLDGDAYQTSFHLYHILNDTVLNGRIRYVPVKDYDISLDPSNIFEKWGRKGIISFLRQARKLKNIELLKYD